MSAAGTYQRTAIIKAKVLGGESVGRLGKRLKDVDRNAASATRTLGNLSIVGNAVITAIVLRRLQQYADGWTALNNKLRQVSTSQENLTKTMERTYAIAQSSRSSLEGVGTLYFRLQQASENMGASQEQSAQITESLANRLTAAGLTASEVTSVLVQTSQAFNKGYLNGDEFRALAEAMPSILDDLSKELGISRSELQKYGQDGKITAAIMGNTFIKTLDESREVLKNSTQTMGQSWQIVDNALTVTIGKFDDAAGVTMAVADASLWLKDRLEALAALMTKENFDKFMDGTFKGIRDDVKATMDIMGDFGDFTEIVLKKSAELVGGAFANITENIRALIKIITTEILIFKDKTAEAFTTVYQAVKEGDFQKLMTPDDSFSKKWEKVRLDLISDILKERDANLKNHQELIAMYDAEIEKIKQRNAARNGSDGTGPTLDGGNAGLLNTDTLTTDQQARYDDLVKWHEREVEAQTTHLYNLRAVEEGFRTQEVATELERTQAQLARLADKEDQIKEFLGEANFERLNIEDMFTQQRENIIDASNERIMQSEKALHKARITAGLQAIGMLSQLNEKSKGLQRASIVANTAKSVMNTMSEYPYPYNLIPAAMVAAIGAKQYAQVGKTSMGGVGGGAAASSPGIDASALTKSVNVTTESTLATDILNELRNRDPNELMNVDYVRSLFSAYAELQAAGTV